MNKRWNGTLNRMEMWDELIQQWVPEPVTSNPTPRRQVIRPARTPYGDVVNTGVGGNVAQAYIAPKKEPENIFDDIFGSLIGAGKDLPLGTASRNRVGGSNIGYANNPMFDDISPYAPLYFRRGRY